MQNAHMVPELGHQLPLSFTWVAINLSSDADSGILHSILDPVPGLEFTGQVTLKIALHLRNKLVQDCRYQQLRDMAMAICLELMSRKPEEDLLTKLHCHLG